MIAASAYEDVAGVAMPHRPCRRALAMSRIDPILPPSFDDRMRSDEAAAIEDADHVGKLMDLDDAPSPIRHAVVVAADRDEAFMAHAAFQLEQRIKGHGGQRLQVELF